MTIPAGNYLLFLGELTVLDDVSIAGVGQTGTTIKTYEGSRVVNVHEGVVPEISGVNLGLGGLGVYPYRDGGCVVNAGTLTVTSSSVFYCFGDLGGGIFNSGVLTLTNSTVSENSAHESGGGIFNEGDLIITNSTIRSNRVTDYQPEGSPGGGIYNTGNLLLTNSTVSKNYAGSFIGFRYTYTKGAGINNWGNLILNNMLGPLQDNGGPTDTHDLLEGSPAIDGGGVECPPPDTDQRGVTRPQGSACDIGAVEYLPEPSIWLMLATGVAALWVIRRAR